MVRSKPKIEHKYVGPFLAFNNKFFEKHQRTLLRLLSHPLTKRWFRWVLRIRKDDVGYNREIVRILPNAYHAKGDKPGEFIADFRTHPKYGKRLYFAFFPVWWAMHFWDWLWADRFAPQWSFGFSTLTAFPAAGTGGTTGDGYVYRNLVNQTLADIRSGAGVGVDNTDVSLINGQLQASNTSNQFQNLHRALMTFDTSALTSSASISAATLSVFGEFKNNGLGSPDFHIAGATPATNANFAASDYNQVQTTSFGNVTYASYSTSAYNDAAFNASGIAAISKTGISKFSGQLSWDVNASFGGAWASNAFSSFNCTSADASGTTNDPKLVVTYTTSTDVTVSPAVQSVVASLVAATVLLGATIAPSVQSFTFSLQAPTAKTDQVLSPNVQGATFSLQTVTFSNDTSVTTTPTAQSLSFATQTPSLIADQVLSPNLLSAAFSVLSPSFSLGSVLSVSAQTLLLSIPTFNVPLWGQVSRSSDATYSQVSRSSDDDWEQISREI